MLVGQTWFCRPVKVFSQKASELARRANVPTGQRPVAEREREPYWDEVPILGPEIADDGVDLEEPWLSDGWTRADVPAAL